MLPPRVRAGHRGAGGPRAPQAAQRPSKFGTVEAEWLEPDESRHQRTRSDVAYYTTHQAALAVRRSLAERGMIQRQLAQRLGVKGETLRRKLQGEAWASLRDLLSWARELGVVVLPIPESKDQLLPSSNT